MLYHDGQTAYHATSSRGQDRSKPLSIPWYTSLLCVVPIVRPRKIVFFGMLSAVRRTRVVEWLFFAFYSWDIFVMLFSAARGIASRSRLHDPFSSSFKVRWFPLVLNRVSVTCTRRQRFSTFRAPIGKQTLKLRVQFSWIEIQECWIRFNNVERFFYPSDPTRKC